MESIGSVVRSSVIGAAVGLAVVMAGAQQQTPPPPPQQTPPPAQGRAAGAGRGAQTPMDEARARQLYVSNKFEDHSRPTFQSAIDAKAKEDARYEAICKGIMQCTKITYRSSVGDLDIPAYLYQPLATRGPHV